MIFNLTELYRILNQNNNNIIFSYTSACKQRYTQRRLMAVDPAEPEKVYIFFKK